MHERNLEVIWQVVKKILAAAVTGAAESIAYLITSNKEQDKKEEDKVGSE